MTAIMIRLNEIVYTRADSLGIKYYECVNIFTLNNTLILKKSFKQFKITHLG